jgi:peroxiredoxin family protein
MKGMGIIFHSGSYDKVYYGLSIAIAASAIGKDVRCLFSSDALKYLKRENDIEKKIDKMPDIFELIKDAKKIGVKIYACTNSMALLNIARNELIDEVDKSTGLTTFLIETDDFEIIFI